MDFRNFRKNPVLLKEENKRFAMDSGKEMRGYINLQVNGDKCLIVVMVENIKFFSKCEYVYKLIFAGTKKEKRRYHLIGSISLSAHGKGEGTFRINPNDLDGNGLSLADCSTAIVAAMSTVNSCESLHPVLKGALSIAEPTTPKNAATPKDFSPFYNKYVLQRCIELAKDEGKFPDITPFSNDKLDAVWKKVTAPTRFPVIAPGAMPPVKKYGHFLYGWCDSHYFLGVPGRFFPEEQPDGGKSGFVFWQPILGMEAAAQNLSVPVAERRKNIYGYWIASINRYNGHIEETPFKTS